MSIKFLSLMTAIALLMVGVTGLAAQDNPTVMLSSNDELGTYFVDSEGMTLYTFANDEPGVSNCTGDCLANWPALTLAEGEALNPSDEIAGVFGIITRTDDGTTQVTYNGMPLYYWVNDAQPGDTTGHLVGDVWFAAQMPTVAVGGGDELGYYLVGPDGFTLYTFANDEPGVSNCTGDCLANWPALTVEAEDALTMQPGIQGQISLIEREDGALQVALNDMPLYYWVNDAAIGDTTGHLVRDVWFAALLPVLNVAATDEFGDILVGPNGMTLYTFANDEAGVSNCVDGCAANWPPLTVPTADYTAVPAANGELGTTDRADGTLQVTYNGAPLYYWVRDVVPGDTTGHNVREVWFVAQP